MGVEMPSIKTNSRKVEEKIAKMSLKLIKTVVKSKLWTITRN